MILLADEIALAAIRNAWNVVALDVNQWLRCFPGTPKDRVAGWWRQLTAPVGYEGAPAGGVRFSLAEINQKDVRHPAIVAKVANMGSYEDPMGGDSGTDDEGILGLRATVQIRCIGWKKELAAALAQFVMQAMFTAAADICNETGAENMQFANVGEVRPEAELLPELGGAYMWAVDYTLMGAVDLVKVGVGAPVALGFSINDQSATDQDGNIGRVKPVLTGA